MKTFTYKRGHVYFCESTEDIFVYVSNTNEINYHIILPVGSMYRGPFIYRNIDKHVTYKKIYLPCDAFDFTQSYIDYITQPIYDKLIEQIKDGL